MMTTLLWKELRSLKMFAALVAGVELLGIGYTLATESPDDKVFDASKALGSDHVAFIIFFGIILGAGLLVRESEDGTLHFLDGLPISRTRIFASKMIAGFLVLATIPFLDFCPDVACGLLSRTSISPPFPWKFCAIFLALNLVTVVYVLSVATAMSFLRKWFALMLGLLFLVFLWLQSRDVAWVSLINPEALEPHGEPMLPKIPFRELAVQGGISATALFAAWIGFRVIGARSRDWVDRAGVGLRFLFLMARICTPIVWIATIIILLERSAPPAAGNSSAADESVFAKQETKRYEFLFRESQRSTAGPLLGNADAICDTVTEFFQTSKNSDRIVVDLASPLMSHALGMTNWSKIRLALSPSESDHEFRSVLGHETAHVIMNRLGGSNFISEFNSTRFFNEGMATVVQECFFDSEAAIKAERQLTAAAASRGKVAFEVLCSNEALSKVRDPEIVYPFGSAFGRALIRVCGPASPARVLAQFNRQRMGSASHGAALWRDIFQSCGYNLDAVIAGYDLELDSTQKQEATFVETLPRLTASIETAGGKVLLRSHYEGQSPGRVVIGVDHSSDFLGPDIRWHYPSKDGAAEIPRNEITNSKIRYMVGWMVKELNWPVFEPWEEATAPE